VPRTNPYRALMSERPEIEQVLALLGGFRLGIQGGEHQDRAAVLVCVSLLEQTLEDAIWHRAATEQAKEERERFFNENGGVATSLAEKIFLAYVLGVIGPETRRDLTRIRQIRNVFAHAKRHLDFNTTEIVELCDFAICKSDVWNTAVGAATLTPREIFTEAVQIIAEGLMCPIALP
jgi:hypothetical protein